MENIMYLLVTSYPTTSFGNDGKELDGLTKGLNIVKSADGKTVKVMR